MNIPGVTGTIINGGLGASGDLGTNTIVVMGPATAGPLGSNGGANGGPGFTTHTSTSSVSATYTSGPLVEAVDYLLGITPSPPTVIAYRTPSSTAAVVGTPDVSKWTGTSVPTWSGTPLDSSEQYVTVVAGGIVGTPGITISDSWDDGRTSEPGPIPLNTTSAYSPPGSGMTLVLNPPSAALYTSINALRTALLAHYLITSGSPAIHAASDTTDNATLTTVPVATTYPTAIALFNTCLSTLIRHVANTGGAYHTTADTVATAALALLTPAVYAGDVVVQLPALIAAYNAHRVLVGAGPVHGSADSTNTCAASTAVGGTAVAGDSVYVALTEPMPSAADITTGIVTLVAGARRFRGVLVTGTIGVSEFISLDAATPAFETNHDYSFLFANVADYTSGQTDVQWVTAMQALWSNTFAADNRISLWGGFSKIVGALGAPNQGRQIRRPAAWAAAHRFMEFDPAVDIAEVDNGPLQSVSISDPSGNPTEHDERVNGGLGGFNDPCRIATLCTFKGKSGTYVCIPWMKVAIGSDYIRVHLRAVMDLACTITYDDLVLLLNKGVPVDPNTGLLDPAKANSIGFTTNADLKGALLSKQGVLQRPRASGGAFNKGKAFVSVSTTDNLLTPGTPLNVLVGYVPLAYLEAIQFKISLFNPALISA